MKRLLHYPIVLLFFGFVAVMALSNLLTPPKSYSEMENRYLAQKPTLTLEGLLDSGKEGFAQTYERFGNDQFVLRDAWITLKSVSEALLGKSENNGIIYGTDHTMFEKYRVYDAVRLERNVSLLEEFSALYPTLNKYVMIVPSAYTILSDKVPQGVGNVEQLPLIENIEARLQTAGYDTVNAAAVLMPHACEYIYYRTDHHWTTLGASYAWQTLMQAAGRKVDGIDSSLEREIPDFYGTHYSSAKLFSAVPDMIHWYDVPVGAITFDGIASDSLYDASMASQRDKYAFFLHGNKGITMIDNPDAPAGTLLVIKDSYANCLVPFLTQSYSRVVVVDLRSLPQKLSELIKQEDFDEALILYSFSNLASDANLPRIRY
ncbi:MAG: DHHW family protein [Oscillospiraceae bacterium]